MSPHVPANRKTERNAQILARYASGKSIRELGKEFGVTFQRIHQILQRDGASMRPPHINYRRDTR